MPPERFRNDMWRVATVPCDDMEVGPEHRHTVSCLLEVVCVQVTKKKSCVGQGGFKKKVPDTMMVGR